MFRPRGKESTEVRKSQIKGKESKNSYQELKRSRKGQAHTNTRKLNRDISTGTAVYLNRKRVNVCEHTTKMVANNLSWQQIVGYEKIPWFKS